MKGIVVLPPLNPLILQCEPPELGKSQMPGMSSLNPATWHVQLFTLQSLSLFFLNSHQCHSFLYIHFIKQENPHLTGYLIFPDQMSSEQLLGPDMLCKGTKPTFESTNGGNLEKKRWCVITANITYVNTSLAWDPVVEFSYMAGMYQHWISENLPAQDRQRSGRAR